MLYESLRSWPGCFEGIPDDVGVRMRQCLLYFPPHAHASLLGGEGVRESKQTDRLSKKIHKAYRGGRDDTPTCHGRGNAADGGDTAHSPDGHAAR